MPPAGLPALRTLSVAPGSAGPVGGRTQPGIPLFIKGFGSYCCIVHCEVSIQPSTIYLSPMPYGAVLLSVCYIPTAFVSVIPIQSLNACRRATAERWRACGIQCWNRQR